MGNCNPAATRCVAAISPAVLRWRGIEGAVAPRRKLVCLYSHDTFGLGHLRRTLAIAEHLLNRTPAFDVLMLTGSPVIG
jgi:hypothetical protein